MKHRYHRLMRDFFIATKTSRLPAEAQSRVVDGDARPGARGAASSRPRAGARRDTPRDGEDAASSVPAEIRLRRPRSPRSAKERPHDAARPRRAARRAARGGSRRRGGRRSALHRGSARRTAGCGGHDCGAATSAKRTRGAIARGATRAASAEGQRGAGVPPCEHSRSFRRGRRAERVPAAGRSPRRRRAVLSSAPRRVDGGRSAAPPTSAAANAAEGAQPPAANFAGSPASRAPAATSDLPSRAPRRTRCARRGGDGAPGAPPQRRADEASSAACEAERRAAARGVC